MAETRVVFDSPPLKVHTSLESLTPSSITAHFDKLSDDLFVEILQRLPLKLIHLCKCVSKRWYGLISTPHFARCYVHSCSSLVPPYALLYQLSHPQCAVQLTSEAPIFGSRGFCLNFLPSRNASPSSSDGRQTEPIRYLASSNGLILCSATLTFRRVYFVCNPLTMHWVELPPPPTCQERDIIGFACKPSDSFDCTSSFRVVRMEYLKQIQCTNLKLEIFSSDSWKWTQSTIVSIGELRPPLYGSHVVSCNGILYWMYLYGGNIFGYDSFADKFLAIRQPKDKTYFARHSLGEQHGNLRFIQYYASTLKVWELKDYNGLEWSLVHNVDLNTMKTMKLDHPTFPMNPSFCFVKIHSIDGDIIYLHIRHKLVLYNMRSKTFKEVCSLGEHCTYSMVSPFVLPFWPTPVPLRQPNVLQ